jgi:23S rRNA pseudouridine1911/1915/1917 synthase
VTRPPARGGFTVGAEDVGARLDRVVAERLASAEVSRSRVARMCADGAVSVNDAPAKAATRLRLGDAVTYEVPPPDAPSAAPEDIPLDVVHEDAALLVVNKPAGLVVHPARGHPGGTLVNAVLFHAAGELDDDDDAPLRPGVVHRIDKDTSGLLVVAKTAAAREALKAQFQAHTIDRSYLAVAVGAPPDEATHDTLHGRHPTDRVRFTTRVREGKRAVTRVRVVERLAHGRAALVRCELETGRTHQIRVHMAEAGFPLLGDPLYGRRPSDPSLRAVADALARQALHAEVLGFDHPSSGARVRFTAPPPADFAAALAALRTT